MYTKVIFVILLSVMVFSLSQTALAAHPSTGVILPLYISPGNAWHDVVQEKIKHHKVPMLVIINPLNGSGHVKNNNYADGVHKMQSRDISVLGYVYTDYGTRNSTDIKNEITNYKNWYNVNGIFFDQMSNVPGNEIYYADLTNFVKSLGLTFTVGNAGVDTKPSYIKTVDNIVIYEKDALPPISSLAGWHKNYDKNNFSIIAFGIDGLDKSFVSDASNSTGYMYVTNGVLPNPFNSIPPYFGDLMDALDVRPPVPHHLVLTMGSADLSKNELKGMWTELHDSKGAKISQGFGPKSYVVTSGNTYIVFVSDYQNIKFVHWDDGSTNPYRTIIPTQDSTVTAYYDTTAPDNSTTTLTVKTADMSGDVISGMWTELHSTTGHTLNSGFGPKSYVVTSGKTYTIFVSDFKNAKFDHWENGSTNPYRTITPTLDSTVTAYYSGTPDVDP